MRVPGTAEAYEKDILAIMQKFTEFDEYGPVYSHADDDPNLSHAEIERWEAAVLKSFSYLVKKEFEISVDADGERLQEYYWIDNRCICFICAGCRMVLSYTQYGWPCPPTQTSFKRTRSYEDPEGYKEPSGKDMFHSCTDVSVKAKEFRKQMKWARTFACYMVHWFIYQDSDLLKEFEMHQCFRTLIPKTLFEDLPQPEMAPEENLTSDVDFNQYIKWDRSSEDPMVAIRLSCARCRQWYTQW